MSKTKRCPFSYETLENTEINYSKLGLKSLSKKLQKLDIFPHSSEEQRRESQRLAGKMSIQGVQPKLSAILDEKQGAFKITDICGSYIIKPQVPDYPELPENEDLTMDLAAMAGFDVPWHGLILGTDKKFSYIIKRFDRVIQKGNAVLKIPMEDFAQLIGATRSTKYLASTERVALVIEEFCTFPSLELLKLYQRLLFSFLIGNEDLHLKNFSLITTHGKIKLSPMYDFLNTTIALAEPKEELALELNQKKHGLSKDDFLVHLGQKVCLLTEKKAKKELDILLSFIPKWKIHIDKSFLSPKMKIAYKSLLDQRASKLS